MRRVQLHAGAGGTLEEGPRRGMGLPRSTLCLIISVLFIVAEEAEAASTVFYTVPKSQTSSKYERPQPPAVFLGLHRLMKADKVSGRFSSHNMSYDDELGRHIKLSYDVERAPDITIHHLDDEAGLIMVNGSSSNELLLHFSSASESQNFHSRITSSHVVLTGGHHWGWRHGHGTTAWNPPILVNATNCRLDGSLINATVVPISLEQVFRNAHVEMSIALAKDDMQFARVPAEATQPIKRITNHGRRLWGWGVRRDSCEYATACSVMLLFS